MIPKIIPLILLFSSSLVVLSQSLESTPRSYNCVKSTERIIVDGHASETMWETAAWSEEFIDIEGKQNSKPGYSTRFKMLWDDTCLYFFARLEEPHIWATLTERESVIFYDNDFEIFIDPDGDNHLYMEYEINAYGTEWDLLLTKPYEDFGVAINSWDIDGVKSAIGIHGSINDASDIDTSWTVEIAMPWESLIIFAPGKDIPVAGDIWRMNFSRVEWETDIHDGKYEKQIDLETGKPLAENNWVWSSQGVINMHHPERWGYIRFVEESGRDNADNPDPAYPVKEWLVTLYYSQRKYMLENGHYARDISELKPEIEHPGHLTKIETTSKQYLIRSESSDGSLWYINQDRRLWKE